jgi:hypothetical protein
MIQVDARIGGWPRYLYVGTPSEEPIMTIPDEIRKCAVFLGYRRADGSIHLAGTGCLVARRVTDHVRMQYLITAKHVISGIADRGADRAMVRLNMTAGGTKWVEVPLNSWHYHPDHADTVDACVAWFGIEEGIDQKYYPLESTVTKTLIGESQIGPGEEVFVTGLFLHHFGNERSIPIVRIGNIAAMPEEKIKTKLGFMDAYLIESRSTSGLSGSPVFAHLGLVRYRDGQITYANQQAGVSYLMGLIHGHFRRGDDGDVDEATEEGQESRINAGIAIVVPIWKIQEIIEQPSMRSEEDALLAARDADSAPVMDLAEESDEVANGPNPI